MSIEMSTELNRVGDKKAYVYFDTEFTGLHKNTTLISIGMVDYEGRTFYAEFDDYDILQAENNPWIEENVISNLSDPETVLEGDHWTMCGSKHEIACQIYFWLDAIVSTGRRVQFVSDVCHYDFVLLLDLLLNGKEATQLPKYISPVCHDINEDIALGLYTEDEKPDDINNEEYIKNYVPSAIAFDINREYILKEAKLEIPEGDKHNSLYDALVIKKIHQYLCDVK